MKKGIIWVALMGLVLFAIANQNGKLNTPDGRNAELIRQISEMTERYNKYRLKTSEIYKRYGFGSKQMAENDQLIVQADAQNLKQAQQLFAKYGLSLIHI